MASTASDRLALAPIAEALPELSAEHYAKVREWDAARMALEGDYEAADGEYLIKIRDVLKPFKLWYAYLEARKLPVRTAQGRIQKAEGRYIATRRADTTHLPSPGMVTITQDEYSELTRAQEMANQAGTWDQARSAGDFAAAENNATDWSPPDHSLALDVLSMYGPATSQHAAQHAAQQRSYSVAEWNALDAAARSALIERGKLHGHSGLNEQKSDSIEWALWSWNPVTGCLHNCPYCYARDIANRFYTQKFEPTFLPERLSAPYLQRVPAQAERELGWRNIFTCSMADLFGKWVPAEWIEAVIGVARDCPQWNFLFLTKFPIRLAEFEFPPNAWLGTSVDCQARVKNAERAFSKVRGGVKWLSIEPMLEPLHFDSLDMFDWLVIGGASASTETPEWHPPRQWVMDLEAAARDAGCMIYEKANLGIRLREYPGWEREVTTLPPSLRYLPSM